MKLIKTNMFKKYAYYTLGLGMLLIGAAQMSPAEKSMTDSSKTTSKSKVMKSPAVKSSANAQETTDHQKAYNSLSPKNKTVFHSLSHDDRQRVVDAHKNGDDPHEEIHDILEEDADAKPQPADTRTPAQKAIHKTHNKQKQNIYD